MIDSDREHPVDKLVRRIVGDPAPPTAAQRRHIKQALTRAIRREIEITRPGRRRVGGTADRPGGRRSHLSDRRSPTVSVQQPDPGGADTEHWATQPQD